MILLFAFAQAGGEVGRDGLQWTHSWSSGTMTMARLGLPLVSLLVGAGFVVQPAQADIYTWTDKAGVVNVSNLPPPETASNTKITRAAPRDAAREAAAVDAARQAEVRALADRVQQLQVELEQSRRETPPPVAFVAPQMPYAPAPTYIVNVVSPPAPAYAAPMGGCGYGFGSIADSASGRASTRPIPSWFAAANMLTITAASARWRASSTSFRRSFRTPCKRDPAVARAAGARLLSPCADCVRPALPPAPH